MVDSDTLQLLPDRYFANMLAPFVRFGQYGNPIASDGAMNMFSRGRDLESNPFANILFPGLRTGARFGGFNGTLVPANFESSSNIVGIIREIASGSWLLAGDFGLIINE